MQKLKEANLYRGELISVSGKLVERYNECLKTLGFTETTLTSFYIDGIGWSPEIAEEKKDPHYLNNGEANPHCILVTPLQKGLPVYNPFHSFDRELMKLVFKTHQQKIENITRDSAICIDFDQKIDVFYEPLDVLKYKNVTASFRLINNLEKAKVEQLQLIELFNKDNNFIDEKLQDKLLASAKKYGDLRERDLSLEDVSLPIDSFYTKAFGGVYILRDLPLPMLVFERESTYNEAIKDTMHNVLMYHISQPELVSKLRDYSLAECDLEDEMTLKRYDRIKKMIFSEYLTDAQHPIKDILEDKVLFKGYLNKVDIDARKKIMGLDRYLEKIKVNKHYKIKDILDDEVYFSLHNPHSSLKPNDQDLIWKLLVNVSAKDVLFLYWYDKEEFYKQYKNWEESKKEWVIDTITSSF